MCLETKLIFFVCLCETCVVYLKVMAHPHLSQALLGNGATAGTSGKEQSATASSAAAAVVTTVAAAAAQQAAGTQGQSNTSLIKSLLATKVNNCMTTVSMRTATDCQNVAQVTPLIQDAGNINFCEPRGRW